MKKLKVDESACIACGYCFNNYNNLFKANPKGFSEVKQEIVEDKNEDAINAVEGCPTGAISLEDVEETKCCHDDNECCCHNCEHHD